jgi:GNAT superfamily N-acetyltransferase
MARHIPVFQFNWLAGAGLDPWQPDAVAAGIARFREAGQQKFVIQVPPTVHAGEVEQQARGAGLLPHALAWAKFRRVTGAVPHVPTDLDIRQIDSTQAQLFAATTAAGFGMSPSMATWLREIVGRAGWHCYVSYAGTEAAGAGALFVNGNYAWIGMGATRPELRRRGGHRALLARRVADAARHGARIVVTETGVPQTDQPAPSYQNIRRLGFSVAYVRPNWTLPA